jgi:hypothetical protein
MTYNVVAKRTRRSNKNMASIHVVYDSFGVVETDEEIENRLTERFEIIDILTEACILDNARALIVSGPAGVGKSYTIEKHLAEWDPAEENYTITKGYVRATALFKLLYKHRGHGQVLVFDDADSIFFDDVSLNLLKAVCDTTERRRVTWGSEAMLLDEETGDPIPHVFDFEGAVIFITNLDFDEMIDRGHKLTPHLGALMSRAHYIDMSMKTRRDYVVRIGQVIYAGLLSDLTEDQRDEVMDFIIKNDHRLRELSLRVAIKIGALRKSAPKNWARLALVTCCRT